MKPDYERIIDYLTSASVESEGSEDFYRQLRLARDTVILRLLKLGLSLREVAGLDAAQIKRLPVPRYEPSGRVTHCIEVLRSSPIKLSLDVATVKSLHHYLMLRGSQKRTIFLRIRKPTPISHTDIAMMLKDTREALSKRRPTRKLSIGEK